jgi:hypothetical protein
MKARIAIQIGVSPVEWKLLRKAATKRRIPLATYVRQAALLYSEIYTEEVDFEKDALKVGVMGR